MLSASGLQKSFRGRTVVRGFVSQHFQSPERLAASAKTVPVPVPAAIVEGLREQASGGTDERMRFRVCGTCLLPCIGREHGRVSQPLAPYVYQ